MSTHEERQLRLRRIFGGREPGMLSSQVGVLADIALRPSPRFSSEQEDHAAAASLAVLFLSMIAASCGWFDSTSIKFLIASLLMASGCAFGAIALRVKRSRELHHERLCLALEELRQMQDEITTYLTDLDSRTRRYFHCVTSTKVSSYCALLQITALLKKVLARGAALSADRTPHGILVLDQLIRTPIAFKDGLLGSSGTSYSVPLHRLQGTAMQLRGYLDAELAALEAELSVESTACADEAIEICGDAGICAEAPLPAPALFTPRERRALPTLH